MKPAKFSYVRPDSVDQAVRALAEVDDSKVLAGGQSLVPLMNFRLAEPALLVDICGLDELAGITSSNGSVVIGATTRMRELELSSLVHERIPLLSHAAHWVGHVQIRNRGTVGGSVAHGDPSAEIVAMSVLFDAQLTVANSDGVRVIDASDFFEGLLTTALQPEDLLVSIRFPAPAARSVWGFREYAQRRGDFALAGVACVVDQEGGRASVVAFGPSTRPVRCRSAEAALVANELSAELAPLVAEAALADVSTVTDTFGAEAQYRVDIVQAMAETAVVQAARMAEARS